jgi:hypothetical protein
MRSSRRFLLHLLAISALVWIVLPPSVCFAQQTAGVAPLVADQLGKGTVPLDGPWQFHLGDDAVWAYPTIDDVTGHDGWEEIQADSPWGAQTHPNYSGYAWYRKHLSISPAKGAPADIALLIPAIDDVYELYWNGVRVGGVGTFPPHTDWKFFIPAQTYGLGPVRDGVLAVRVFKIPFSSVDDGTAGGFERLPQIGSPNSIAQLKDSLDYRWMRRSQFRFGLTTLYGLTAFLSFLAWLRDREQKLLFWLAAFTFVPLIELTLNGMRLPVSGAWLTFFIQSAIDWREICQWFLLVYLLQLEDSPRLLRFLRFAAWVSLIAGALDGATSFMIDVLSTTAFTWIDASLTALVLLAELLPIMLVLRALLQRKRLAPARWLVAFFAFASATWYAVSNFAYQGIRYTHWTLSQKMDSTLFSLFGSNFPGQTVLRTLLFVSIVFAVVRFAAVYRRRQAAMEQEFQNARELQQVLIPDTLPELPGYAVTSSYRPAQEVGGDFFQILELDKKDAGSTLIVVGDVSGKGLKAAMTVALIVGALRTLVETTSSPGEVLAGLNRRLFGRMQEGFATCVALRIRPDGKCVLASAGHPAPYHNHREIDLPGALPLGLIPSADYQEVTVYLREGDRFSLYTDGLLEARSPTGEIFSFERLEALFADQHDAVQASDAAVAFGQDDDITVLTLTRLGQGQEPTITVTLPKLTRQPV